MFNQKEYQKEWYQANKERLRKKSNEYRKVYYRENKEKIKEYRVQNKGKIKEWIRSHLNKPEMRQRHLIRKLTYSKYGKLPCGFNYHHTTEPYNVDEWIGIDPLEHYNFHSDKRADDLNG